MPTKISHIAHIILAAGSSSRLGSPKQLLPWTSGSLIEQELRKSMQIEELTTYVILGANFEIIKKEIAHYPIHILQHKNWHLGMGTSISFGVQHILNTIMAYDAVLITLVDQPFVDIAHLHSLILENAQHRDKIIATKTKETMGVPAIFPKMYFEELTQLKQDYGARYILKKYKEHIRTIDGADKTDDIDTLEQYKALLDRAKRVL